MYRGKGGGPVIFVVSPPGSEPRRLALGWSPAISPDGEAVVYLTWWRYRWGQLRIINADGSGNRRFTHLNVRASDPDWSPDGKGLAITARENHKPMIAILDMLGKNLTPLTEGESPRWSPDGEHLAFCRPVKSHNSIWIIRADGTGVKKLWEEDRASCPTWLPDGKSVAFSLCKIRGDRPGCQQSGIYRQNLDGTKPEEIVPDEHVQFWDLDTSFSPEQRAAFDLDVHRGSMNTPHALGPWFNVSIVWERQERK